jgi:sterol desaturase/sphingolipid hydroxylase (fatty acid hydroxylase superfamily)
MAAILNLLIPVCLVLFMIAEAVWPARPLPKVRFWRIKGIVFFVFGSAIFANAPLLWADFASAHRVLDLSFLGAGIGALVMILVGNLLGYFYHRARHALAPLWRLHQLHHSAERIDTFGTFYHHPIDTLAVASLGALSSMWLLGVSADAAAIGGFVGFQLEVLTHANVRTPRWLGYLVQRPESHRIHHMRGVHAFNYGLPIFDMIFGTFRNPEDAEEKAGFWDGASGRVGAMLALLDVTTPPVESAPTVEAEAAAQRAR